MWDSLLNVDIALFFDDVSRRLNPDATSILLLANPVLPHSEGEVVLESADPALHPAIRMNYFADPHDMKVMVAVLRRTFDIAAHWPVRERLGAWMAPLSWPGSRRWDGPSQDAQQHPLRAAALHAESSSKGNGQYHQHRPFILRLVPDW